MNITRLKLFLFDNQTNGQTIVKNTIWLSVGKLGGRLLRTVLVIYAARILGASDWGVFSYAISLVAIFAIVTDFGISPILVRETAKGNDRKDKILSTAFFLKLFLLVPALIFIIFFANHLPILKSIAPLLIFFLLILFFDSLRQLGFSLIKAMEKMEIQAGLYILTNITVVISGLFFLARSPSIASLTYAYTFGAGIGLLATVLVLRRHINKILQSFDWKIAKEILLSSWPLGISSLLGSIMISTDIFIIGLIRPAQDVGFYSVADRVVQLLYAPALILATSTFPVFSRLANKDNPKLKVIFERLLRTIYIAIIPITVISIFSAPFLVTLFFGKSYLEAVPSLQILLLTLTVRYTSVIISNLIFAYDQQKFLVKFTLLGVSTNIFFDIILIPIFGIVGSAWATLLAQLISNVYLWHQARKINNITPVSLLKYLLLLPIFGKVRSDR